VNTVHWFWPQWSVLVFLVVTVLLMIAAPPYRYSSMLTALIYIVLGWALWMGGFWS